MNLRSRIVLLLLAATLPALPSAHAQITAMKAVTLPEGTEPYGPAVLLAKEDSVPLRSEPGFVYREIRFLR